MLNALLDLQFGPSFHSEAECDVVANIEVGKQSVGLEHGVYRTIVRRPIACYASLDADLARIGIVEARDESKERGLAAAGRSEQGKKLTLLNRETHAIQDDRRAETLMQAERVEGLRRERLTLADVGYMGQSHYIEVPIELTGSDVLGNLYRAFETAHQRLNGHKTGAPAKIVNLRVVHRAHRPAVPVGSKTPDSKGRSQKGRRSVLFPGETARVDAALHDRALLAGGERLIGPAIIEQTDSTTLLPAGWSAEVTGGAALLISRSQS